MMIFKARIRTRGNYSFGITIPITVSKRLKLGKEYTFEIHDLSI